MNSTDDAVAAMKAAREAWIDAKRRLDSDKVWSGAEWHYNPCPPFKYRAVVKIAEEQIAILDAAIKAQEAVQRTRCSVSFSHPPHDFCDGNPYASSAVTMLNEWLQEPTVEPQGEMPSHADDEATRWRHGESLSEPPRFTGTHTVSTGAEYPIETIKRQMPEPPKLFGGYTQELSETIWGEQETEPLSEPQGDAMQNKLDSKLLTKMAAIYESRLARGLEPQDAMQQAYNAARALLREAPAGWRPIESAPKDGRLILSGRHGIEVAYWSSYCIYNTPKFTHWMPLPAAPKEGA